MKKPYIAPEIKVIAVEYESSLIAGTTVSVSVAGPKLTFDELSGYNMMGDGNQLARKQSSVFDSEDE